MTYDPPTPNLGLALPTLGTGQKWESAVVKDYFSTIDAAFGPVNDLLDDVGWEDFSPTWNALVVGNGVMVAKLRRVGSIAQVFVAVQFDSTSLIGSDMGFNLPIPRASWIPASYTIDAGRGQLEDVSRGGGGRFPASLIATSTLIRIGFQVVDGNTVRWTPSSNVFPFEWSNVPGSADRFSVLAEYPIN